MITEAMLGWRFLFAEPHGSAAETDEFMARLIDVYKKSLEFSHVQARAGCAEAHASATSRITMQQRGELGIHRSDYMIDSSNKSEERLLQVELNTISSAFPMISEIVCGLHKYGRAQSRDEADDGLEGSK